MPESITMARTIFLILEDILILFRNIKAAKRNTRSTLIDISIFPYMVRIDKGVRETSWRRLSVGFIILHAGKCKLKSFLKDSPQRAGIRTKELHKKLRSRETKNITVLLIKCFISVNSLVKK